MNFLKAYKFPLSITLGLIAVFFIFQNGTCGSGDRSSNNFAIATENTDPVLTLNPINPSVTVGTTLQFSATNGSGNYQYSLLQGAGSLSANGSYTASPFVGTAEIAVEDISSGLYAYSIVSVTTATPTPTPQSVGVFLSAPATAVTANNSIQITITGGSAPYSLSLTGIGGTFSSVSASGVVTYTAPANSGQVWIQATDANGNASSMLALIVN